MREPTPREIAVVDALTEVARPVILSAFSPDSCIAATRIGIDVLDYFGIRTREMPLMVAIFNPDAARLVTEGMTMDEVGDETRKHAVDSPGGPWTVGLGGPTGRADGWAGHLLIAHPDTGILIDLSADQANRPHKNITLQPYWVRVPEETWWQDPTQTFAVTNDDGVVLIFDRRCPDPTGYQTTPNWKRRAGTEGKGLYRDLTGQIIRLVKERVD